MEPFFLSFSIDVIICPPTDVSFPERHVFGGFESFRDLLADRSLLLAIELLDAAIRLRSRWQQKHRKEL